MIDRYALQLLSLGFVLMAAAFFVFFLTSISDEPRNIDAYKLLLQREGIGRAEMLAPFLPASSDQAIIDGLIANDLRFVQVIGIDDKGKPFVKLASMPGKNALPENTLPISIAIDRKQAIATFLRDQDIIEIGLTPDPRAPYTVEIIYPITDQSGEVRDLLRLVLSDSFMWNTLYASDASFLQRIAQFFSRYGLAD